MENLITYFNETKIIVHDVIDSATSSKLKKNNKSKQNEKIIIQNKIKK